MALSMFSAQVSPIAIDFGSASVKLLQISRDTPAQLVSAVELPVPDSARQNTGTLFEFYARELPKGLASGRFKGKRAVTAIPSAQSFVQHMQIQPTDGVSNEDLLKAQLQMQLGVSPAGIVVRAMEMGEVSRGGQTRLEMICFAIARDTVMRYVELLKKCKLEVVGVHTEIVAMVRAFEHLYRRRDDDQITTLFVDLGWGGMRVAVAHGRELKFARYAPVGGRHFDQLIAAALNCDIASARAHRLAFEFNRAAEAVSESQSRAGAAAVKGNAILNAAMAEAEAERQRSARQGATAVAERRGDKLPTELKLTIDPRAIPTTQGKLDLSELLSTITDEVAMCLRYHHTTHPNRPIDRVVFVGGESQQTWLCQHVLKELRLPGHLGDPMARLQKAGKGDAGIATDRPQPGWTVPFGLCIAPTDI
jgi:Tfp pilus assembly PilM family ATPase